MNVKKKVEEERKLWEDLKKYVKKNMKETFTEGLIMEINDVIKERTSYLKNMCKK